MSDPGERQALQDLLHSDGWRLFERAMQAYWQDHLSDHVAACANELNDAAALNKLRQVVAAKQAVDRAMAWPKDRLRQISPAPMLSSVETVGSWSRGGI